MTEDARRDHIAEMARSLHVRGLTHGSTGNISARLPDGRWLVTPTGVPVPTRRALTLEFGTA
jgi:ribulose-5-phosphate 4-epimerase/fuculose-1-phosphate aldolase